MTSQRGGTRIAGLCCTLAWLAATGLPAWAAAPVPVPEQQFLMSGAEGSMAEIALGKLALEHATQASVKEFARHMITEHTQALHQTQDLAKSLGITLPKEPVSEFEGLSQQLAKLQGRAFDLAYLDAMVSDHTQDVAEFKQEAQEAKTPGIKALAKRQRPVLEAHLSMAKLARQHL